MHLLFQTFPAPSEFSRTRIGSKTIPKIDPQKPLLETLHTAQDFTGSPTAGFDHFFPFFFVLFLSCCSRSAVYCGARLAYNNNGKLTYDSGRAFRFTLDPKQPLLGYPTKEQWEWMEFTDTKIWASNGGIGHWGKSCDIVRLEVHDTRRSAFLFGEASIRDALFNSRTANTLPQQHIASHNYFPKFGFQFYDTFVKTIVSRVTFRGYQSSLDQYAFRMLDHSDFELPQGLNSVRDIIFEDVDRKGRVKLKDCGKDCGTIDLYARMAAKIYSIVDWDGSVTGSNTPRIIGTNRDWWSYPDGSCAKDAATGLWNCPFTDSTGTAYFQPYIPGLMLRTYDDKCDPSVGNNGCKGSHITNYRVGTMSQWGSPSTREITLSPFVGITGLSNSGW